MKMKSSKKQRKPSTRIFYWVLDGAAFIHRIVLSVNAERKENFDEELQRVKKYGIFHPDSIYARVVCAFLWPTGNFVEVLHGRIKRFRNVPTIQIKMRSEGIPLTAAQVKYLIRKIVVGNSRVRVSMLEFTFDVTGVSIEYVLRHLVHSARKPPLVLSDGERKTIYIGSPRSAWQVRIYEKTETVLRLEFILRRAFLSRHGIKRPEDVLLLRKLDVWKLMSIRRPSARSPGVLRPTRLQKKLESMQRHFIW
jgi:hypothetical protein